MSKNEIEIETKPKIDETKKIEITTDTKGRINVTRSIEEIKFEPDTITEFEITRTKYDGNSIDDNSSNIDTFALEAAHKQNEQFYDKIKVKSQSSIQQQI